MGKKQLIVIVFLLLNAFFPALPGCAAPSLQQLPTRQYPKFADDLIYFDLNRAIEQSLIYLKNQPPENSFSFDDFCTTSRLVRSLVFFRHLMTSHPSPKLLALEISTYFDIYQASGNDPAHRMLVTGYYQPLFEGSLIRKAPFLYPLYAIPSDLALRRSASGSGAKQIGRLVRSSFKKYWTRGEIENLNIAGGNELLYLKSPIDAFLLHIQGSGLIRLRDGRIKGIHYAMKNGRRYKSIGKYMVKTGRMNLEEASISTIVKYLTNHPEEMKEILHHNESFIFFEWTSTRGAMGNLNRTLTAGRSIAVDQHCFPAGALAFLRSRKPIPDGDVINWEPLRRFVLVQDTGSAIRGPGRVDLFWGSGQQAGLSAGTMKEDGTLYFLLLKKQFL
jgi:membrane-bound lytic murein transglycosylase A